MSNHTTPGCSNPDCMYSTCRAARARKLEVFDGMAAALRDARNELADLNQQECDDGALIARIDALLAKAGL